MCRLSLLNLFETTLEWMTSMVLDPSSSGSLRLVKAIKWMISKARVLRLGKIGRCSGDTATLITQMLQPRFRDPPELLIPLILFTRCVTLWAEISPAPSTVKSTNPTARSKEKSLAAWPRSFSAKKDWALLTLQGRKLDQRTRVCLPGSRVSSLGRCRKSITMF